jgi:ADP-ribosyl-[dinitrogen reductase] hydrolase
VARDLEDAALGCLLGGCIGDAAGATLEFQGLPARDDVERAMAMSGGGYFRLAPGQITDDSERGPMRGGSIPAPSTWARRRGTRSVRSDARKRVTPRR